MRALISLYLLFKSATRQKFTWFDIALARALGARFVGRSPLEALRAGARFVGGSLIEAWAMTPIWLAMIANLKQEAPLPEAFRDWWLELGETLADLIWGKS